MKFKFFSRHALTVEQIQELKTLGFTDFESVNPGVILSAQEILILAEGARGIGLVAPGRIWAKLFHLLRTVDGRVTRDSRNPFDGDQELRVFEAESRQAPELRVGEGPIPFVHVVWHRVF